MIHSVFVAPGNGLAGIVVNLVAQRLIVEPKCGALCEGNRPAVPDCHDVFNRPGQDFQRWPRVGPCDCASIRSCPGVIGGLVTDLLEDTFARIAPRQVVDAGLGVFRLNTQYFNRLKKIRPDTDLAYRTYHREQGVVSLPAAERESVMAFARQELGRFLLADQIQLWT